MQIEDANEDGMVDKTLKKKYIQDNKSYNWMNTMIVTLNNKNYMITIFRTQMLI